MYFFLLVTVYDPDDKTIFLHFPVTAGDRFSPCHCAVVTILFLVLWDRVVEP